MNATIETKSWGLVHWFVVVLTAITGLLHVYAGVIETAPPVLLAGVGLVGALVLFALDYRRQLLYLVGLPYTLVQIPLWYVVKAGEYTTIGYVDKTVQVLLIGGLASLYWQERRANAPSEADAS